MTSSLSGIKYSGADWLRGRDNPPAMSGLGIRVANVLGQVYQGIYHLYGDRGLNLGKVYWDGRIAVSPTVYGTLATFDHCQLTLLVLACIQANLEVGVYGSFKGYTRLVFNPSLRPPEMDDYLVVPVGQDRSPQALLEQCVRTKKRLNSSLHNCEVWSTEGLTWPQLLRLVAIAHTTRHRFQLQGRSPQTLEIMVTRRQETGKIWERHPGWAEHRELLRRYWDVDYSER